MKEGYVAGADIGGTKISVVIASKNKIICKTVEKTKKQGSIDTIPNQIDDMIKISCNQIGIKKSSILNLGIISCGAFEKKGKYTRIYANNICRGISNNLPNNWPYLILEKRLSKLYKNIKLMNDAKASAQAEYLFGSGKKYKNFVYVTWSTGIGTGAYVNGFLLKGKNNNAPHAGHIYLSDSNLKCNCGQLGDFESLVSGASLEKIYGKKPEEIFKEYKQGNKKAIKLVKKAAKIFARGLVSINAILDTEAFILGGSIMKNKHILLPLIKKEFYNSFKPLTKDVKITTSKLEYSIGDLGALSLVMNKDWIRSWQKRKPWKHAPEAVNIPL
jgi:glucokinase